MSRSSPGSSLSHSSVSSSDGPGGLVLRRSPVPPHIPGLQDDDPPFLLSPRPRSWSAAQREASGQSSPEIVERLLGALLGDPASAQVTHEEGGSENDAFGPGPFSRGSSVSPNGRASFTPTDPPSSSPPSDPRSSAYTLARLQQPSSSSSTWSSTSDSSSPRPEPKAEAPSPHSAAAQEVLRTLAAMSSSRPDERAPFASTDLYEFEQQNGYRRLFDSAGLSAVEERTEERTVGSGSVGSAHGQRSSPASSKKASVALAQTPLAPPPSAAASDSRSASDGSPRRARTPDPVVLNLIEHSPPRPQSSSPTKRDVRLLGLGVGSPSSTGPRALGASRSTASLIALFENGRDSAGPPAPLESAALTAAGERKSAPLLLQGVGSPPPSAFSSIPSRLGDRRTYLSPVSPVANLPGTSPPSYASRSSAGTGVPRRSVFDLPQFLPRTRSISPGAANVETSPTAEAPRLSRPSLGLFPLLSFGGAGSKSTARDGDAPADDDDEGSSPLEALTPQPMLEGQLPPLPRSSSEGDVLSRPTAGASAASSSRWRRPRRPSFSNLASAVLGGGSRKTATSGKSGHGRTWTEAAVPLVRRGAVVVRSLSRTGGRGRPRANSAPPAPPSEVGDELGEARSMRDEVATGFSWRPQGLTVPALDALASYNDVDGPHSAGSVHHTRHTPFDTSPSSSVQPEHGHSAGSFAPILTASVSRTSFFLGDSPFTTLDAPFAPPASIRSFDPAIERDLERSSTISTIARTDVSTLSDGGSDRDGDDERSAAGHDPQLAPGPPPPSDPSSSSSSTDGPPDPPSIVTTRATSLTDAEIRSTETVSAASSSRRRRFSNDFPASIRPTPTPNGGPISRSTKNLSISVLGSQPPVTVEPGILTDDISKLLLFIQRQEQWRIGRDALQASQLEHIQQDVMMLRDALTNGGPPLPPKDPPSHPSSSTPSSTSSSSTARPNSRSDGGSSTQTDAAAIQILLERISEAEQAVLIRQDDIRQLLVEDQRRRREEREARAAEATGRKVTLHRLDDLLRRVLWLLGDEVFHGEGGPPTVEESIYGPDVRPLPSHPPASISDMPADENTRSWHESGDSFVSRSSWHSSERGISQLANPPPSADSTRSGSRLGASPLASIDSPTTPAQSFSSLPPASPISIAQSQLDEQDRRWDEIRRNRSLPRRPLSVASSASTIRPALPVALPPEIDDALDELARRTEELDERERRLDDDESRVQENADAQARWLAEETDRLDEEEGQLRQAAEDEAARIYNNLAPGRRRSASDVSDITAGRGARERQSRLFQHPANDRPAEHHRRPLPPPEPIDLPSPVHDRGGRRPPGESDRRPPLDFDRRTASLSLPYPEPIPYPRMGSTRPAATGARAPITQPFVPRPSRSAFDAAYADYGSYSARSRPGLFGSWFPRRSGRSYGYPAPPGYFPAGYGRGPGWLGGYPPPGTFKRRNASLASARHSSSSPDDDRHRTTQHVNEVTERVNDLQKEVHDLRDHQASAAAPTLNATFGPVPGATTVDATGRPSIPLGPTLFEGHPATHSRRSSGSDRPPVNVTINAPPAPTLPPAPPAPRPSSPPGALGALKDLAGPAIGGLAGAALGDRHGRKEEEKENKEERREERKALAEERKADERAAREAAAVRPAIVIPPPLPGSAIAVPPPGVPITPGGQPAAVVLPAATSTPGTATVIPPPGRPALAGSPALVAQPAGQAAVQPTAQPAAVPVVQPTLPSVATSPPLVGQPAAQPAVLPVIQPIVPAVVPAVASAALPSIVQNAAPPAATVVGAASGRPLPVSGSPAPSAKKTTTTTTTTVSEESAGESSTTGPYTTAATSAADVFRPQAPVIAAPGASILKNPGGSGSQPSVIVPPPGQTLQFGGKIDPLADPDMLVRNGSRRPAVTTASNVKPATSDGPAPTETQANPTTASAPAGKPAPSAAVDRPASKSFTLQTPAPPTVVVPPSSVGNARPTPATMAISSVAQDAVGPAPSNSAINARPSVPPTVAADGTEPELLQTITAPVPPKSIFKRGPRAPAVLTVPAPLGKTPAVAVVPPPSTSDGPPSNVATKRSAAAEPTQATPAVNSADDVTRPLPEGPGATGKNRKPVPVLAVDRPVLAPPVDETSTVQPGAFAVPSTRPAVVGVPAIDSSASAPASRPSVTMIPRADETAASSAKPPVAAVVTAPGGQSPLATARPAVATTAPGPFSANPKKPPPAEGAPPPAVDALPMAMPVPPAGATVAHSPSAPPPVVTYTTPTPAKPAAAERPLPPPVAVLPVPEAVIAPVKPARPVDAVSNAPQKLAAASTGPRPNVVSTDAARPLAAQAADPSRLSAAIFPALNAPVVLDAKGKPVTVAAPSQAAAAPFAAAAAPSKPAIAPGAALATNTTGKPSVAPMPPGSMPIPNAAGVAAAPPIAVTADAAGPSADLKKVLDEMAKTKAEQQAILKAIATEADKSKKEQAAWLATLAAEVDKAKKEQQAQLKALSADLDKSLKAAQKETTDEMKKTAKEQVAFNVSNHLDEFSKALAGEVKTLMKEVGDLREAKRALQHEIADLLLIKARHGAGDGMNLFPWQAPKPAAPGAKAPAAAPKPSAPPAVPKPAAAPPAPVASSYPPPWWMGYAQQALAAPVAPPKPPVPTAPAVQQQQQPAFMPPWAMYAPPQA